MTEKRSLQTGAAGVVAGGAGLVAVTYGVVRYGYGLQLPAITAELGLTPSAAGLVAAGSFAAYCATALLARRLVPRRGARAVLWVAAVLAAAGGVLVALAPSAAVLAVGVLVAGGAAGAASPALVVAIAARVAPARVDRAQAVVNAGTGAGVAVAGAVALVAPHAWRPVWAGAAVAALLVAAVVDRATSWPAPTGAGRSRPPRGADGRSLQRPALAAVLAGVGSAAVWTFGRDLLTTTGGLPARTSALLWCLLGVAAVLGAVSGDAVRVLGLGGAWWLTAVASAVGTLGLALAPDRPVLAGFAAALFGGAYTALSGVLIAWAAHLRPAAPGPTTAVLFVALTAGQAVGATVTGAVADAVGPVPAFLLGALLLLAAAVPAPRRTPRAADVRGGPAPGVEPSERTPDAVARGRPPGVRTARPRRTVAARRADPGAGGGVR
ncbi:MFS transporter [Cellulomonas iranensis]|uniref:MFS transporter n=1 Tax=Cellulomonas iranensis TaxID=76862 RepID=UPI000B3CE90B|nr:MFS transporter [Cellulomonas iranensis]